jgi:hypothetical protein
MYNDNICLDVDYHPGAVLAVALEQAGIGAELLPWKTIMRIEGETIKVKEGYSTDFKII